MVRPFVLGMILLLGTLSDTPDAWAQADPDVSGNVVRIETHPTSVEVAAGESASLTFTAYDADGREVDAPMRFAFPRTDVWFEDGRVHGTRAGVHTVTATLILPPGEEGPPVSVSVPVRVLWPPIREVELERDGGRLYVGTAIRHRVEAYHGDGTRRPDPRTTWSTSDPRVATVNRAGDVIGRSPGTVTVTVEVEGVTASIVHTIEPFHGKGLRFGPVTTTARTGDVIPMDVEVVGTDGRPVPEVPITWSFTYEAPEGVRTGKAPAQIDGDGRFVADRPGVYTILASAGPLTERHVVEVERRRVIQQLVVEGRGRVVDQHSSDFWPWQGSNGRHYAISGTWRGGGWTFVWDITDPTNLVKTDSIQVDARTVNDVKVSPDGRYGVITREGASDRVNGLVILDLSDPAHPVVATEHAEGLTGGVHNTWPTEEYLYALSGFQKYVIIDVSDIYNPKNLGEYNHPNSRVHDVIVHNGIAFSAEWNHGIVVVDVGHGGWGGSPEDPVFITNYPTPGGRTHTVIPYEHESTGRLLVFASDEVIDRPGMALPGHFDVTPYDPVSGRGGRPMQTSGYTHIVDFSDIENPRKIAKYHVPEFGTHNPWIEDDILYQAYFEGGVRLVDVSGELMGNLYSQGREIAVFKPVDPGGFFPNAPFTWSVMPYEGRVFFSDGNSGLWSARLEPRERPRDR